MTFNDEITLLVSEGLNLRHFARCPYQFAEVAVLGETHNLHTLV